jgi:ankyrin repeat protein
MNSSPVFSNKELAEIVVENFSKEELKEFIEAQLEGNAQMQQDWEDKALKTEAGFNKLEDKIIQGEKVPFSAVEKARNESGATIVMQACVEGWIDKLKPEWLNDQTLFNDRDKGNYNALYLSMQSGHVEQIIDKIKPEWIADTSIDGMTPAIAFFDTYKTEFYSIEPIKHLLTPEIVTQRNENGESLLKFAIEQNRDDELKCLLPENTEVIKAEVGENRISILLEGEEITGVWAGHKDAQYLIEKKPPIDEKIFGAIASKDETMTEAQQERLFTTAKKQGLILQDQGITITR